MVRWRLVPMAVLLAVAGCGLGGDGLDQVHEQNLANLAYPADDDEATLRAVHDRLAAAAGDDDGEVTVGWRAAGAAGGSDPSGSIEVEHRTTRYQFTFETLYDDDFRLTAPGLGSFEIVAARYILDLPGTNLPPIYSQPVADSARADLLAYLRSPEDLAANAAAKLETLRAQTQEWLDLPGLRRRFNCEKKAGLEGQVTECDEAELSDAQRDELRATADATIESRLAEVQENAEAVHALLVEATLADRCPACWG